MRIAFTALALAASLSLPLLSISARAETIVKERFGCHTKEVTDRLFKLVAADDDEGFVQLLRVSLASGECRMWKPGEEVRIETQVAVFGCLAVQGSTDPCYWTSLSAVEKPE